MEEIWKDVVGYEGLYKVSNTGRLVRKERRDSNGRFLSQQEKVIHKIYGTGYYGTAIVDGKGNSKNVLIHRLVAMAFIPNPNNYPQIDHIDGNKSNNRVENLRWCTAKQNINFLMSLANRSRVLKVAQNKPETIKHKIAASHTKAIIQYDMNGNVMKEWSSLHEISRECGYNISNISACANGRKTSAYGFIWKHK